MKLISHNKALYELRNLGNGFVGHVPSSTTITEGSPAMRWTGAKIPSAVWQQIVSFFQWSFAETNSETQVRLLMNTETGEFKAHAFPQKYGTGMTAKELSDSPDYERQLNEQMAGGNWIKFGTAHHHCSVGAFQSGTDSADEKEMGIHITLGNINGTQHSIHARVSLVIPGSLAADGSVASEASHAYYTAVLSDWFHPPEIPFSVSDALREEIVKHQLCQPIAKEQQQFPPIWAENLIKEIPKPVAIATPNGYGLVKGYSNGYGGLSADYYEEDWGVSEKKNGFAAEVSRQDQEDIELVFEKIHELMDELRISMAEFYGIMHLADMGGHCLTAEETAIARQIEEICSSHNVGWHEIMETCHGMT